MEKRQGLIINILLTITGLSFGFGASQLTMAKDLHVTVTNVENLRHEFEQEKDRTDKRIFSVVTLVEKMTQQNTELITLIRVQNQQNKP